MAPLLRRTRAHTPMLAVVIASAAPAAAWATDFHVDPVGGSPQGDGSAAKPWKDLQDVLDNEVAARQWDTLPYAQGASLVDKNPGAPVQPGDRILLHDGDYGAIQVKNTYNQDWITVAAAPGNTPRLRGVAVTGGAFWAFEGLVLTPSLDPDYTCPSAIAAADDHNFFGPTHDVRFADNQIYSVDDAGAWGLAEWNDRACDGVSASGSDVTVRGNTIRNVDFGIQISGPNAHVAGNTVVNFAGDGMRGLGDFGVFEDNVIKNCYDVNDNHDDGFQSWSTGPGGVGTGEVRGVVLRRNVFINYEDPNQPFRGPLQGIGCFDGMFVDWVVENNLVVVDHYHGISLLGCTNCRIVNNTVFDPDPADPGPAWIMLDDHKDGTVSTDSVVRNNLAASFPGSMDPSVVRDFNLTTDDPAALFVDAAGGDFHLRPDAPAVDAGSPELAPSDDLEGTARPQGAGVDIGAYEYAPGGTGTGGGTGGTGGGMGSTGGGGSTSGGTGSGAGATAGADTDGAGGGAAGSGGGSGCGCRSGRPRPGSAAAFWFLVVLGAGGRRHSSRARGGSAA